MKFNNTPLLILLFWTFSMAQALSPGMIRLSAHSSRILQGVSINKVGSSAHLNGTEALAVIGTATRGGTFYSKRNQVLGLYAEEYFVRKNRGWQLAARANDAQHDVFIIKRGKTISGQIKTHANGDIAQYLADMKKDNASTHFIVPDNHIDEIRERIQRSNWSSSEKRRQINRLTKGRFTITGLERYMNQQGRRALFRSSLRANRFGIAYGGYQMYRGYNSYRTGAIGTSQFIHSMTYSTASLGISVGTDALYRYALMRNISSAKFKVGGAAAVAQISLMLWYNSVEYGWGSDEFTQEMWHSSAIALGQMIGTGVGALAGSFLPGAGTAFLGLAGGIVGAWLGDWAYSKNEGAEVGIVPQSAKDELWKYEQELIDLLD